MDFNIKLFLRQSYQTLFKNEGTSARLTPKRIIFLLIFFPFFLIFRLVTSISFLIDDLFYRDYQQMELHQPVFILGNARSGTTFLHRLMARDRESFSVMRMWEIFFAPSITQRKVFWFVQKIDNKLGKPMQKQLLRQERKMWLRNPIHKMSLREPEEDESILFNIWSSIFTTVFFPDPELVRQYAYFDKSVPRAERRRVMQFYKACLRRHQYAHKSNKRFISKNPTFSPKIDALYEYFPDAKIVYLVRNPIEAIPSLISWMSFQWGQFCDPMEEYPHKEYLIELAEEWYRYPLERLETAPSDSYIIVKYDDLVADPGKVVTDIYNHFGFEIGPRFARLLERETQKAQGYKSKHTYSLKEMGLTKQRIIRTFKFVFERFGFEIN